MVFCVFDFLQKMNERIQLYYYDSTSFRSFLEEIEDTKIIWPLAIHFLDCSQGIITWNE